MDTVKVGAIGYAPQVKVGRAPDYDELVAKEQREREALPLPGHPHSHVGAPGPVLDVQFEGDHDKGTQAPLPDPGPRPPEQELYQRMWGMPEYRKVAPGEHVAQVFLEQAKPRPGSKVLDLGCGTGRGGFMLAVLGQMDVTFVDFTSNSIDEDILPALESQKHTMRFVQADLTQDIPVMAEYGFCTDVMEHIPPEQVQQVLKNILKVCEHVFFQIATEDDVMGKLVGHKLHLSVHSFDWWLAEFQKLDCAVHWSKEVPGAALFYLTAWQDGHAVVDYGVLNTTEELVRENVRKNTQPFPITISRWEPRAEGDERPNVHQILDEGAAKAALSFLRKQKDTNGDPIVDGFERVALAFDASILDNVTFGPFPAGRQLDPPDPEYPNDNPDDEVRIGYWWGNSNLYWPLTLQEWEDELAAADPVTPRRWKQVTPFETHDMEVMVLGGGPSLALFEDEIRQKRKEGVKLVTMNGAYNWCIEHDIGPISAQVVVDARPFNARFTRPIADNAKFDAPPCKFLIASQVDPSVLEGLPYEHTYLWHTTAEMFRDILNKQYARWYGIPGGSTVLLRTLPLLRVLGAHMFHLYGCDSCIVTAGEQRLDHAYAQPENPPEPIMPVNVGGKIFACYGWHCAQAQQFIDLIRFMGHEMQLNIPGDGLLAHILNHGAAEFDKSVFLQ